jgi:polar amino acid transport system substrate-binding protein
MYRLLRDRIVVVSFGVATLLSVNAAAWAQTRPLCVAVTDLWAPFNLTDEQGRLSGIGIDYWETIAERMGTAYRYELKSSWEEVLRSIERRTCDLTVATEETESRLKYALFSKPYVSYPVVIVTRMDVGFIDDLDQIAEKTIALPKSYATTEKVLERYRNLRIIYTDNIDQALKAVSEGKAFATVGVLPVVSYKITKTLNNLKIAGKTSIRFNVGIMVRSDRPELVRAVNRAIDTIPEETMKSIYDKWTMYPEKNLDYRKWLIVFGGLFTVFGVLFFGYVFKLKKEAKERSKIADKWKRLASIDELTGAASRRFAMERLQIALQDSTLTGEPFGLVFCDVDYLKKINDAYGHETGDRALKRIAETVRKELRADDLFGRWGGDEFIIVLPDADETKVRQIIERLKKKIETLTLADGYRLSCSFGYAVFRKGDTRLHMFRRADEMLYRSKRERNEKRTDA